MVAFHPIMKMIYRLSDTSIRYTDRRWREQITCSHQGQALQEETPLVLLAFRNVGSYFCRNIPEDLNPQLEGVLPCS